MPLEFPVWVVEILVDGEERPPQIFTSQNAAHTFAESQRLGVAMVRQARAQVIADENG
jgi:hypothetical protein